MHPIVINNHFVYILVYIFANNKSSINLSYLANTVYILLVVDVNFRILSPTSCENSIKINMQYLELISNILTGKYSEKNATKITLIVGGNYNIIKI